MEISMKNYTIYTNIGNREINEDSVRFTEKDGVSCYVLADGLGGHGRGDEASSIVVDEIIHLFQEYNADWSIFIKDAIEKAQEKLLEEQRVRHAVLQMKTTIVVLVVTPSMSYYGHVGDSRLYLFKGHRIKLRTIDHSVPQMLVLSKAIKESEIRNHPDRNKLLRVLGIEWDREMVELAEVKRKRKQAFLLCSDGFWELVEEKQMEYFLKKADSVDQWMRMMVEEVQKKGINKDMDNYSAIAVWL